ncbi:MAG: DUF3606 domain-containing protein [Lautropia sp.]
MTATPDTDNANPTADALVGPDAASIRRWAAKLDASEAQIRDAIRAVGPQPADVEAYLKGSHATTNAERVRAVR